MKMNTFEHNMWIKNAHDPVRTLLNSQEKIEWYFKSSKGAFDWKIFWYEEAEMDPKDAILDNSIDVIPSMLY